jgi:hypothetical protein
MVLGGMTGLLVAEHRIALPETIHELAQVVIVLAGYLVLHLGLRAAAVAARRPPQRGVAYRVQFVPSRHAAMPRQEQ